MIKLKFKDNRTSELGDKISINMLSQADLAPGQGVSSAYHEQVDLVSQMEEFEVLINSKKNTDIVHHHTINPTHYLRMLDKSTIHVAYCHFLPETLDGSINLPKPIFDIFKKYVVSFYKRADYLVVVNPIFIDMLASYGIDRESIFYIPNFVSKEEFYEDEVLRSIVREEYEIAEDDFVVLGVGQVQTRKGVMDFIEVAKALPNIKFVWAGGFSFGAITDGYDDLKEVYENPPANVEFIGIVDRDEMNGVYNMADVLFMPSYNELFPMSILEAINLRRPMVLRDLELYEDILFDQYLKGHDNDDFAELLDKLSNDKDFYRAQQENSLEISNFYSREHVGNQWREFYTGVFEAGYEVIEEE